MKEPTSESFAGKPDGTTSYNGEVLAKRIRRDLGHYYPTSNVRQDGYGPSSFDVQLGENDQPNGLIATVTVEVKREKPQR